MKQNDKERKAGEPEVEQPTAGCGSLTSEQVDAIIGDGLTPDGASDFERFFYAGFLTGLQFVCIREEDGDMYGRPARDFAENGYRVLLNHVLEIRLKEAAQEIFDYYEMNTEVVGSGFMVPDGDE